MSHADSAGINIPYDLFLYNISSSVVWHPKETQCKPLWFPMIMIIVMITCVFFAMGHLS